MKSKIIFWKWQQKQYSASALMGAHEMSATHDYLKQEQNKISWLLFRPKLQTWPYSLHSLTNLKIRILMISHLQRVAQCLAQGQYCVNTGEKEWLNAHPPIERGLHRNLEDVGEKNGRTVPTMHSAFPVASFTYLLGSRSPWCYLTPSSKRGNGAPRGSVTQPEVEKGWHPAASGCWHLPPLHPSSLVCRALQVRALVGLINLPGHPDTTVFRVSSRGGPEGLVAHRWGTEPGEQPTPG